jgi:micrococcal nuclease
MLKVPHPHDRYVYSATLVRVIDGDTVVVDIDLGCEMWLRGQHCRLYGINAPEPHTKTREAGDAATAYLNLLLQNSDEILVRTHFDKRGSFKRLLVDLFVEGMDINAAMVEAGHAVAVGD